YDGHGNITSKTGMGSYTYASGTHRVISTAQYGGDAWSNTGHCNATSSANYCYDEAGNMTADDTGRTLNYTAYDKPYRIEAGSGHVTEFLYGPNRARYVRQDTNPAGELQTTFYVGNVEKIVYESGDYTIRRYIAGVGMIVQDYNQYDSALESEDLRFFYKDHLGSLSVITGADGQVVEQMSFDSFGKRRHHE
ncbi:hypothetical protein, partial [uncultured Umboniibacter sp.]|uniref:hypothetical protein n=1 Tax=uncultured Umboniibacter sp. TaxID=1798917 RepID=UPI00262157B3